MQTEKGWWANRDRRRSNEMETGLFAVALAEIARWSRCALHDSGVPSQSLRVCNLFGWCGANGLSVTSTVWWEVEVFGRREQLTAWPGRQQSLVPHPRTLAPLATATHLARGERGNPA